MLDETSQTDPDVEAAAPFAGNSEFRPTSGEAPFHLEEVFFSRTDDRGIIRSGNEVFRRVSHYEWSELIGAPHKTIRHPDMPKGVFWLFWDTIKKGEAMGAYVKNRSKDGLHYWVYASAVPCDGGYLSARIKPSGPMLKSIVPMYEELLRLETEEGISPEESAQHLLTMVKKHGFKNYKRFEAHALSEEFLARQSGTGMVEEASILRHRRMLEASTKLREATEALVQEFEAVRIIPHNMRVMASRLEPNGGPFNTLSGDYGSMSTEMSNWFEKNVVGENSNFSTISSSVNTSMFFDGTTKILKECSGELDGETGADVDTETDKRVLSELIAEYRNRSLEAQQMVHEEAGKISIACQQMNRHVLGLSTTRVLCKIESARMGAAGDGLADIIGQLGRFQEKIGDQLSQIEVLSEEIQNLAALAGED